MSSDAKANLPNNKLHLRTGEAKQRPLILKKRWAALTLVVSGILLFFSVTVVLAVHDLGIFELDRNTTDQAGGGDDWVMLYAGGGSAESFTGILSDTVAPGQQFQGGGSKDSNDISQWLWQPGEPLDKDDITNAYAGAYIYGGPEKCPVGNPPRPYCTQPGDLIIYYGLDRFANNGSAQVGFWFFKIQLPHQCLAIGRLSVQWRSRSRGRPGSEQLLPRWIINSISVFKWVGRWLHGARPGGRHRAGLP
jgi:hypothetical protein